MKPCPLNPASVGEARSLASAMLLGPWLSLSGCQSGVMPYARHSRRCISPASSAGKRRTRRRQPRDGLEVDPALKLSRSTMFVCFAGIEGNTAQRLLRDSSTPYARNDVLQRTYGCDSRNSGVPADEAEWTRHYARTGISLDSSLNMSYCDLSSASPVLTEQAYYEAPLSIGNTWCGWTSCLGYQVIAFDSGYYWQGGARRYSGRRQSYDVTNSWTAQSWKNATLRTLRPCTQDAPPFDCRMCGKS